MFVQAKAESTCTNLLSWALYISFASKASASSFSSSWIFDKESNPIPGAFPVLKFDFVPTCIGERISEINNQPCSPLFHRQYF